MTIPRTKSSYDKRSYDAFYRSRVGLAPGPVFAILGVLSGIYFLLTGTVWAVTGEFTRLGGHLVEALGADIQSWTYYQEVTTMEGNPSSAPTAGSSSPCSSAPWWPPLSPAISAGASRR